MKYVIEGDTYTCADGTELQEICKWHGFSDNAVVEVDGTKYNIAVLNIPHHTYTLHDSIEMAPISVGRTTTYVKEYIINDQREYNEYDDEYEYEEDGREFLDYD